MVAAQAEYGPHAEEADDSFDHGGRRGLDGIGELHGVLLCAQKYVGYITGEYVQAEH